MNALPEAAWAIANHRIADHSSPAELIDRFINITLPVAAKHNMTLVAFGKTVGSQGPSWGTIRLNDAFNSSLMPAPVTPTTGSGPYELLSGTIRSTFQTHLRTDGFPTYAVVSPGLSTGEYYVFVLPYGHLTDQWIILQAIQVSKRRHDGYEGVEACCLALDTRHYWNLTRHIFRYGHRGAADAYNGAHTINEGR